MSGVPLLRTPVPERAERITLAFARAVDSSSPRLCSACVDVLQVSGAGVTLMSGTNAGPVCASNERAGTLEELQFTLGQGPCREAFDTRMPVAEPQLERNGRGRWPGFTPPALDLGTRGVFAFPLQVSNVPVGVLTLYQDRAGDLTSEQVADSLVVAEVLGRTMIDLQADGGTDVLVDDLADASSHRAEVHQASGMLAVRFGMPVADALARLRAYAYAAERPLADIALDVVQGRLRLDEGTEEHT